jgi:hypothetical protein
MPRRDRTLGGAAPSCNEKPGFACQLIEQHIRFGDRPRQRDAPLEATPTVCVRRIERSSFLFVTSMTILNPRYWNSRREEGGESLMFVLRLDPVSRSASKWICCSMSRCQDSNAYPSPISIGCCDMSASAPQCHGLGPVMKPDAPEQTSTNFRWPECVMLTSGRWTIQHGH